MPALTAPAGLICLSVPFHGAVETIEYLLADGIAAGLVGGGSEARNQGVEFRNRETLLSIMLASVDYAQGNQECCDGGWPSWPPSFLLDQIDLRHLFHNKTKDIRVIELMLLPEYLRIGCTFADTVLKVRDDFAAERGVDPRIVRPNWPEEMPKY